MHIQFHNFTKSSKIYLKAIPKLEFCFVNSSPYVQRFHAPKFNRPVEECIPLASQQYDRNPSYQIQIYYSPLLSLQPFDVPEQIVKTCFATYLSIHVRFLMNAGMDRLNLKS